MRPLFLTLIASLGLAAPARAGLYYSGEKYAPLPSQWRGYVLDHRALRNIAVTGTDASPLRTRYLQEAATLQKRLDAGTLDADGSADLGALTIRLGAPARAAEILRAAQREHPNHFRIVANLGTAWQLLGEFEQAAGCLREAVRLAPGKDLAFEEAHLALVLGRLKRGPQERELDEFFGIRYLGDDGSYTPGKLAAVEQKKLPARAIAIAQQLALWLPADAPLLWQLAELAGAHGDIRSAAAMMDGCVTQFNLDSPVLRDHRRQMRAAADALPQVAVGTKTDHEGEHRSPLAFRSRRPLLNKLDLTPLPAISDTGSNAVPWELFAETQVDRPFRPNYPRYLQELVGKRVELTGFMIPGREEDESAGFLFVESPIGCWYCEMPELTGIISAVMPAGQATRLQRGLVRVTGRLELNTRDPEEFLFTLRDARVGGVN